MTKQEAIQLVNSGPSSILTREDVVKLLSDIQPVPYVHPMVADASAALAPAGDTITISREVFVDTVMGIVREEISQWEDISECGEIELSIEYDRTIDVDATWDSSEFSGNVEDRLTDWLDKTYPETKS